MFSLFDGVRPPECRLANPSGLPIIPPVFGRKERPAVGRGTTRKEKSVSVSLARRIREVQPSATLAVDAKARQLKAQGVNVVGFGAGEPDLDTPEHIVQAGVKAMSTGDTKYGARRGAELKQAVCNKLKRENGLEYQPAQVLVSNGAKHSLYNLFQVMVEEGGEVIIPAPYWVSYLEMARLAGGKPVILETSEATGFKITPRQLESAVTPRTQLFIFNSPSNPTGATYTPEEVQALAEVIVRRETPAISDEIYEHLIYGGIRFQSLAAYHPKLLRELVVTVNGVSKTFAMTGWRIGYAAGPEGIVKAAATLQSHATSDPASFSQAADAEALTALAPSKASVEKMKAEFNRRRIHMHRRLNALPGVQCLEPAGAFYCFPDVSGLFGRTIRGRALRCSLDFVNLCLDEAKVALVPGEAFGSARHARLSYATSMEQIDQGLDRIGELLKG
jgi:aspartate aminotransferase